MGNKLVARTNGCPRPIGQFGLVRSFCCVIARTGGMVWMVSPDKAASADPLIAGVRYFRRRDQVCCFHRSDAFGYHLSDRQIAIGGAPVSAGVADDRDRFVPGEQPECKALDRPFDSDPDKD